MNLGVVVAVRGSIVDVRFDARLPPIYTVMRAGPQRQIVIEVLSQRDASHVRGIALTPTQGLARGAPVEDSGGLRARSSAYSIRWTGDDATWDPRPGILETIPGPSTLPYPRVVGGPMNSEASPVIPKR